MPGQAAGQHGLAGSGRAEEQEVVAAGGGDLERAPGERLAAHVGQVGSGGIGGWRERGEVRRAPGARGPASATASGSEATG